MFSSKANCTAWGFFIGSVAQMFIFQEIGQSEISITIRWLVLMLGVALVCITTPWDNKG